MLNEVRALLIFAITSASSAALSSDADGIFRPSFVSSPHTPALERAFATGLESGDFAPLRTLLVGLAGSEDANKRLEVVMWLAQRSDQLAISDYASLVRASLAVFPASDPRRRALVEALVEVGWRRSNQEERRALYRTAVDAGSVTIWEGATLAREVALIRAASEGLTEFLPDIRRYAGVLDSPAQPNAVSTVARLSWRVSLREGAKDAAEGSVVAARKLRELPAEQLASLLSNDRAFLEEAILFAKLACEERGGLVAEWRKIVVQQQRQLTLGAANRTEESASEAVPNWMVRLESACP